MNKKLKKGVQMERHGYAVMLGAICMLACISCSASKYARRLYLLYTILD